MATLALRPPPADDNLVWWAILLSIALHILLAYVIPRFNVEQLEQEAPLLVRLMPAMQRASPAVPAAAPAPSPAVESKPVLPAAKTVPDVKPVPVIKTDNRFTLPQQATPKAEPSVSEASSANAEASNKPAMPATTSAEGSDSAKAGPAAAEVTATPAAQDTSDERNQYGNALARHIDKYKQYPRIAQMRNWQGRVVLELQLDANGNLTSSRVQQSSSYESLDKQALEMVKKASPFPLPPPSLRGRSFSLLVPVVFNLE